MRLLIYTAVLLLCSNINAQQPPEGLWLGGQLQLKLSDKWVWHNDAGYRTAGVDFLRHQILYRTGGRYFISKNLSVAAGGAIFFTRSSFNKESKEMGQELRLWQEAQHQLDLQGIQWQNRFTVEQRFFDETSLKAAYTAHRFRLKTIFTKPVSKKWSIQLSDEYMRQLTRSVFAFDQNRVMIFGVFKYNQSTMLRAGYMWFLLPGNHSRHLFNIHYSKTLQLKHAKNKTLKA